jgi:hypothetical protein
MEGGLEEGAEARRRATASADGRRGEVRDALWKAEGRLRSDVAKEGGCRHRSRDAHGVERSGPAGGRRTNRGERLARGEKQTKF